ncbi:DUF4198 domain-containing protein [Sinimarinibacterium sp. NLF-5-8]|uniref:DUF4198 domain-containing protein n=1 Tax=Sinimarinibacterium sp. NLF-5-8 TaxID=2698684 RepID=UPI00137BF491|nr:DUF4198 domain-containing protein [Sinimarinibacterium sp. NLF-5-8]
MKFHRLLAQAVPAVAVLMTLPAQAHNAWFQPSKTVLNVDQWVTVDAGASTEPFVKDHAPLRLDHLRVTAPDGSTVEPQNPSTGRVRSTFDLQLLQAGTYKIALQNQGMAASWEENGQGKRWPPRGQPFTAEGFAKAVPKNAANLSVMEFLSRIETYVTAGKPGGVALKPSGKGLELVPVTDFNDLFTDEPATFQLLLDGKPAAGQAVEIIADGIRYRDAVNAIELTTGEDGRFTVQWPSPGLYWMSASAQDSAAQAPATRRRSSYTGVFEVLSP